MEDNKNQINKVSTGLPAETPAIVDQINSKRETGKINKQKIDGTTVKAAAEKRSKPAKKRKKRNDK